MKHPGVGVPPVLGNPPRYRRPPASDIRSAPSAPQAAARTWTSREVGVHPIEMGLSIDPWDIVWEIVWEIMIIDWNSKYMLNIPFTISWKNVIIILARTKTYGIPSRELQSEGKFASTKGRELSWVCLKLHTLTGSQGYPNMSTNRYSHLIGWQNPVDSWKKMAAVLYKFRFSWANHLAINHTWWILHCHVGLLEGLWGNIISPIPEIHRLGESSIPRAASSQKSTKKLDANNLSNICYTLQHTWQSDKNPHVQMVNHPHVRCPRCLRVYSPNLICFAVWTKKIHVIQ